MGDDKVEIYCPACGKLVELIDFEECFTDREFTCPRCGSKVYWKNCPLCETGYIGVDPDASCPECPDTEDTPNADPGEP